MHERHERSEPTPSSLPELVVGVGASAGGLEALERLVEGLKPGLRCALVVVQHLSPEFQSRLDELLGHRSGLPVVKAESGQRLQADTVYVTPPGQEVLVQGGKLQLVPMASTASTGHLIDLLLRSIAHDMGPRGAAVILSGTGTDGTRGVRKVHGAGGAVLVQLPESAEFDGMPRSALETGLITGR